MENKEHKEAAPIIVVRKKKHGRHAGHGGAWKVAYADFVTAMMALFIVLWINSQDEKVRQSIANYFKDPQIFSSPLGSASVLEERFNPNYKEETVEGYMKRRERENLEAIGEKVKRELGKPQFRHLLDQLKMEMSEDGFKIELCEKPGSPLFEPGTANLQPHVLELIRLIAKEVRHLPNQLKIEGHSESRVDVGTANDTNFDLCIQRANSVRRALTVGGVRIAQVAEVSGYADRRLRNADNPFDISNRRIVILVLLANK